MFSISPTAAVLAVPSICSRVFNRMSRLFLTDFEFLGKTLTIELLRLAFHWPVAESFGGEAAVLGDP